jgi:hypothetical protein
MAYKPAPATTAATATPIPTLAAVDSASRLVIRSDRRDIFDNSAARYYICFITA